MFVQKLEGREGESRGFWGTASQQCKGPVAGMWKGWRCARSVAGAQWGRRDEARAEWGQAQGLWTALSMLAST